MTEPKHPLDEAVFAVGGEDQFSRERAAHLKAAGKCEDKSWDQAREVLQVRLGTVLKTDTVSILLGAGASRECGGILLTTVPIEVEKDLRALGFRAGARNRISPWLVAFYVAARRTAKDPAAVPIGRDGIVARDAELAGAAPKPLDVNLEALLSTLHRWRSALPAAGGRLQLDGDPPVDLSHDVLDHCLKNTTDALARRCILPRPDKKSHIEAYKLLLRKLMTRPLNLKRVNIFTLNYDTLVEQAADAEGVVLLDGFVGSVRRVFRPESYDQDLYFPADTTEGRVHRFDRVAHLYKLHGSVTWGREEADLDNPYGVRAYEGAVPEDKSVLIYPTPAKVGETVGMPYSELFRRFASTIARPQSTLIVLGSSFGDEHVAALVRQALAIPSFTLVIASPKPAGEFVDRLLERKDRRVWVISGESLGTFAKFIENALPDLRDEAIREQVQKTYRALGRKKSDAEEPREAEGE